MRKRISSVLAGLLAALLLLSLIHISDVNTGRITGRAASNSARHSNILVTLRMVFIVSPRRKMCCNNRDC